MALHCRSYSFSNGARRAMRIDKTCPGHTLQGSRKAAHFPEPFGLVVIFELATIEVASWP
eukprot:scaffold2157_cov376-Prasinococcus_capsulatus_cf.AAC.20